MKAEQDAVVSLGCVSCLALEDIEKVALAAAGKWGCWVLAETGKGGNLYLESCAHS